MLAQGTVICARYEVRAQVDVGGMGEVYRAFDQRLGREVALKIVRPDISDRETLQRFEREWRALATLNHPNIVAITDVGTVGQQPYFVMELLHGQTLRQLLSEKGQLPWHQAIRIVSDVTSSVSAIHEAGFLAHRDVKAENVFLTSHGVIKLLDLGIVKAPDEPDASHDAETKIQTEGFLGTRSAASPEQLAGGRVDQRTDIFAIGLLLHELITGRHAFRGNSWRIETQEPDPLSSHLAPVELGQIITRCLEKSPGQRFQSSRELLAALKHTSADLTLRMPVAISHAVTSDPEATEAEERVSLAGQPLSVAQSAKGDGSNRQERKAAPSEAPPEVETTELDLAVYSLGQHSAHAIRIVGAADESFGRDVVHVSYDPTPYVLPPRIAREYDQRLEAVRKVAESHGSQFFDGPCTRLSRLVVGARDSSEDKHINVTLGPLSWYAFSVVDHWVHEAERDGWHDRLAAECVDAVRRCDFGRTKLPNIIETVTTVVTDDRRVLYSWRSAVSTVADMYSATVSENIHREKDAKDGVPDPFRAALRGIGEELSPKIGPLMGEGDLVLLGICFNTDELHPTFLFLARVPITLQDLFAICREAPGKDYKEGVYRALFADADNRAWETVLSRRPWYASGEACLLRALEFLRG